MSILDVVAVVAIVAYVIGRQLLGEPLRGKRLILLPLILAIAGTADLTKNGRHPGPADIVLIAIAALVAAVIGLGQGSMMRLEARHGVLWGQMPRRSLWLWAVLVASHGVLDLAALGVGAHVAASTSPILLTLGVNRLAQALVIGPRALRAGIPFAPEKDGSTFLTGLFGSNPPRSHPESQETRGQTGGGGPFGGGRSDIVRADREGRRSNSRRSPGAPTQQAGGDRPFGDGGMQTVLRMIADWLEGRPPRR